LKDGKDGQSVRFAIVRSRFNDPITRALQDGARKALTAAGVPARDIECVEVPGAFELPLAALWLARSSRYAAIICLGCVIRGQTPHFEYVAGEAARGISAVALSTGVPVIFGVLTTEDEKQAWARAAATADAPAQHVGEPGKGNKGFEAAQAALQMVELRKAIGETAAAKSNAKG
jgi:6,7-dimethyl-8-ribityllumazine synthase